jgi:hypothetical protein
MKNSTLKIVGGSVFLSLVALAFMTADQRYVAAPGLACVVMVVWLWMSLWVRDQKIPFFDAGFFCALATLVYTVYPLVNFWVDGMRFGLLSDSRLQQFEITPYELGFFHLRNVLYLFFLVTFYSLFRGRGTLDVGNIRPPSLAARQIILFFFLALTCYFFLLQMIAGVNVNSTYESEAFANNVNAISSLPLSVLQISGKLEGILFVSKLGLLSILIGRCREKKWFFILLLWMAAEILQTFLLKGSRHGMVFLLLSSALLYHRMIKPLSMRFIFISGTLLFIFFIFLGLYRDYIDFVSFQSGMSQANTGIFSGSNEFQALLGTAYDVYQRKAQGTYLPWYLYINDFVNILPPQQLLFFEKVPASEWYLRELNLSGTGLGFMWGVVSQSIVGFDWFELPVRGAILGFVLARIHRWYLEHQSGFFCTLLYMYLCIKVYYTYRDTTFSLLANFVWEIIPFFFLLRIGVAMLTCNAPKKCAITITPSD